MNEELRELLSRPTANIEDVGRVCFGMKRASSYRAAERGTIPAIRDGRRWYVPTAALRKLLQIEAAAA
jgi:hypothetical protein